MVSRRYLNFDLLLEQEAVGQYQARVTQSPLGETPMVRFRLPFDATTLENLLLKLDPGRSGTRRVGATSEQQAAMDFGGPLYQAVFTGDLALAWTRSLDRVRTERAGGLRLRLKLNDAPAIAGLPWELLYDEKSNNFLAQSERTPMVRFLDLPEVPRPMTVDGPLRVLAIISSPVDLEELDVEGEWQRISEALKPRIDSGLVVLDRLPSPTIAELGPWLRRSATHVIHFVGHGDFDEQLREGVVYFQDQHGRSSPVTSSVLGPYLRDHDPLRMVVLNACRSARTDAVDPFGGMAQGLVQQDATAVVAMQFPITDRAAVTFTGEFYGALVDGLPVDQAVSCSRKALLADFRDEWATPVLFLRSPDGNIFENVHAASGGTAVGFLTTQAPPETDTAAPDETEHSGSSESSGPSTDEEEKERAPDGDGRAGRGGSWVRQHTKVLAAGVGALLVIGMAAAAFALVGNDPLELPRSTPLTDTQLLVAAGEDANSTRIFRVDTADPGDVEPVSPGDANEWLPVLSPDRRTVVYSRERGESGTFVLRAAGAADGSGDRELFDNGTPDECATSTGRPAWIPGVDQLVMRCFDEEGNLSLLRTDIHGKVLDSYLVRDGRTVLSGFGDPTVSPDGKTIVVFGAPDLRATGGSLFSVDVATGRSRLVKRAPEGLTFSDAVFSPSENRLAWRADVGLEAGGFEIFTATLTSNTLGDEIDLSAGAPGKDQDPMFSPDGTQVVYGHAEPGQDKTAQTLTVADVSDNPAPHPLLENPDLPDYQSVPAWSRR